MLSKQDFDNLNSRIENITKAVVEEIEGESDLPPTIDILQDSNKTYAIMAAILFIDIRKSTYLTESSQAKSMVKIYRSFMRMAVECVRKNDGVTRQFMGDRIMGVFIDSMDENGNCISSASDKAVNCARSLQTVIDYSLNRHLKNNVNGKIIECGIGIDYGKVLVTKVGMYGNEKDDEKENEVSCVWVGNVTNYASKYSDIAEGSEIFISNSIYKKLSEELKIDNIWTKSAKYKGENLYEGYVTNNFYLDYNEELGTPVKVNDDTRVVMDTSYQLAEGINAIEKLQNKLIVREKELAVLEERIKKENEILKEDIKDRAARIGEINRENYRLKEDLTLVREEYLESIKNLISTTFIKKELISQFTKEWWLKLISDYRKISEKLNYEYGDIITKVDNELIDIYSHFKMYEEAYNIMIIMAKKNRFWVHLEENVIKWANTNNILWKLYDEIEKSIVNKTIDYRYRERFESYLLKIKQLRGY